VRTEDNQSCAESLEETELLKNLVVSGDKIHVQVADPVEGERVIREILRAKRTEILDLQAVRPSLEDAFVSIVREKMKKE